MERPQTVAPVCWPCVADTMPVALVCNDHISALPIESHPGEDVDVHLPVLHSPPFRINEVVISLWDCG